MMESIRYNFILPSTYEEDLTELRVQTLDDVIDRCVAGEFIWAFITYYYLKKAGLPACLSCALDQDAINLAHSNVLRKLPLNPRFYCVSLQADFPHFRVAQYHIVQNAEQVVGNAAYVDHWTQPGQIPRDTERRGVTRVAYQGAENFTDLDEARLNQALEPYGITFEILGEGYWLDLSEVDILVGVRSFSRKKYKRKPPTKLINSWLAGVPFIGGWDSAYEQVGCPGEDYLQVGSFEELWACIMQLKDNPSLYDRVVNAGREKAKNYTTEAITKHWIDILQGEVASHYYRWRNNRFKSLIFAFKVTGCAADNAVRHLVKIGYRIPAVRRLRDLFYDPVK